MVGGVKQAVASRRVKLARVVTCAQTITTTLPTLNDMSSLFRATSSAPAKKDVEVADLPQDSISSLSFSPVADYLAVGSWDNNVRGPLVSRIPRTQWVV